MRTATLLMLTLLSGCASTVSRIPGPVETPGGEAKGPCESERFLTLGKTRYRAPHTENARMLIPRDDGLGVYAVGDSSPESVSALEEQFGPSSTFDRHRETYSAHDRDRWIAAGLGVGAAAALTIGTIVLVGAFETKTTTNSSGARDEEQVVSGGQLAAGGIIIGAGFGLGIGGMLVAPSAAERARADAARYVYHPPEDDVADLRKRVGDSNARARQQCTKGSR